MAEELGRNQAERVADTGRLDSWKEIAAYLKRDATTVRRWEKREGLPVHRHQHDRRDSVYAYITEIDGWWQGRRNHLAANGAVESIFPRGHDVAVTAPAVPDDIQGRPRVRLAWGLAWTFFVATLLLGALLISFYPRTVSDEKTQLRFSISPPEQTSFGAVSLSPDGRHFAFTAARLGSSPLLWVRPLDSLAARSLPETEDAAFPFWSADSDALAFFAGGKLWTIDISGGRPRPVCDAALGRGGSWNRDDVILFAPGRDGPLYRVPASGGTATPVTIVERPDERGHMWPEFLPDGKHFLYLADGSTRENHNLFVGTLDTKDRTRLFGLTSNASLSPDGLLVFAHDGQLMAQPFDSTRLVVTNKPITLAERVLQQPGLDHKTDFSISATGILVYRRRQSPETRLVWRDRSGQPSELVATPAEYFEPTLSPDERLVAIDLFDPTRSSRFGFGPGSVKSDILILDRAAPTAAPRLTTDPGAEFDPVWAPDGKSVVFSSNRLGGLDLYRKYLSGGSGELLFGSPLLKAAQAWSPDGRFLVFGTFEPATRGDLWLLPMFGDRTPVPLLRTKAAEEQAQISPDGRWFAYTAQKSGRPQVYVQSFPSPDGREWQISTNGGGDARWRRDGSELFYVSEDRRLMAVPIKTGAIFAHGTPAPLFDIGVPPHWYEARNLYDVSRDGRFLFMVPVEDDRSLPYTVVVNWTARRPE